MIGKNEAVDIAYKQLGNGAGADLRALEVLWQAGYEEGEKAGYNEGYEDGYGSGSGW